MMRVVASSKFAPKPGEVAYLRSLGIYPVISGAEPSGIHNAGDVVIQTADGRPLNDLWREYQAALDLYNAERDRLMAILTFNVTNPIEDVFQGGDTINFEQASEHGLPRAARITAPTFFSMGYSFNWWDIGQAFTWMFLAEADSTQVDSLNNAILEADNRKMFEQVMKAVFNNVQRAATIKGQNYNVFPFYNGDSTVPPKYKGTTLTAPHTHYLVSGAATVESTDFDDAEAHLKHHGYGWQTGTALIALVNSAQMATIRGFRVLGTPAASYDFIQASGTPSWALAPSALLVTGGVITDPSATPPSVWNGLQVQGRYGPWLVIEEDQVPAGYMLFLASGGDLDARNPVGIREHASAALRGLRLVKGPDPDYPIVDSYYQRGFGTGIRQRGAGVVTQIKASGTYDIPAAYV